MSDPLHRLADLLRRLPSISNPDDTGDIAYLYETTDDAGRAILDEIRAIVASELIAGGVINQWSVNRLRRDHRVQIDEAGVADDPEQQGVAIKAGDLTLFFAV